MSPAAARPPRAWWARPVLDLARELIGATLSCAGSAGVIVETEAYHDTEAACHAHIGLTRRTHVLFGPPGTAYVYRSYGIHALFNVVAEAEGVGAAVLVRALRPVAGLEAMGARRGRVGPRELCSGPGKLTQALGIELPDNGADLTRPGRIEIRPTATGPDQDAVVAAPRIGIIKAAELPWRFCLRGSPWLSRPVPVAPR